MKHAFWLALAVFLAAPAAAKDKVTTLFATDDPLTIEIDGPIRAIAAAAERSTDPRPATLRVNGETLPVTIEARGNARRRKVTCAFPPLRVTFAAKPAAASLFEKQKSLKMVTHCRNQASSEQLVMREYATYRIYQKLSDQSLKVRLLDVRYTTDGKEVARGVGFFIEDMEDAARRFGLAEVKVPETRTGILDRQAAARNTLFQYMIGNHDWDLSNGPAGSNCCHNYKFVAPTSDARSGLIPVPYDFDYAGLVGAPYAVPPAKLPIDNVRQRWFRGCSWQAEAAQAIPAFRAARPALQAELAAIPRLSEESRQQMRSYLDGFWSDIERPNDTVFKRCGQGQG